MVLPRWFIARAMHLILAPKILIVGEMSYLSLGELGATIFFRLVGTRDEYGRMIVTSKKSYGRWGSICGDPIIATVILDGLLHQSTTVNIRGDSYRLKEGKKAGLLSCPPLPAEAPEPRWSRSFAHPPRRDPRLSDRALLAH